MLRVARVASLALVVLHLSLPCRCQGQRQGEVEQQSKFVWPVTTVQASLLQEDPSGQETAKLCQKSAAIAEKGFQTYRNQVLPKELELDPKFAAEFKESDESRWNLGFFRWQKRAWSLFSGYPIEELLWDGKPVPQLSGILYSWDPFFKSKTMKKVAKELTHLGREYLASLDDPLRDQRPRLMMWAEVYEPLAFHGPHSHTGVPVVGIFAARCEAGSQDISFEDPRGINPPFGKKERFSLSEGEVLLFPSWASHFLEPNLGNSTNVFISFALEKGRGPQDFDWEDDATGSFVETRVNKIKRGGQKKTSDEQQRTEL